MDVLVVWEYDFMNNREETINKCVGIINEKMLQVK
jgi:hypothetical protein